MGVRLPFILLPVLAILLFPPPCLALPPLPPVLLPGFPLVAGDNVIIVWSPIPEAASYKVYRNGAFVAATVASSYAGLLSSAGEEARYQVSALSKTGEESRLSSPGIVRLRKIPAPAGIESSVQFDPPSVILVWSAVPGAFAYNVYRAPGGSDPTLLHSGGDLYLRDRSVREGFRYGYVVAAIDRHGREGERTRPHVVELQAEAIPPLPARKTPPAKPAVGAEGRGEKTGRKAPPEAPYREAMSIERIENLPLGEVSFLGPGGDNVFWVVRPRVRQIHAIDRAGNVVTTWGPATLDPAATGFIPHKLGVGPDGRLVVSDIVHGVVACIDPKGVLLWSRKIDPPPDGAIDVWKGFPPNFRSLPASPSSVLVLPGEILVTDQRLQLIYRLSPRGDLLGHVTHYGKGGDVWRLRRIGELEVVPGRGVLLTFPLVRKAILVDEKFVVLSEIEGTGKVGPGRFLGLHGVRFVPGEGVLLTDPTTGRIKMFDPETGEHLRDLKTPALLNPNMAAWERGGRIWVYLAREKRIAVLAREAAE